MNPILISKPLSFWNDECVRGNCFIFDYSGDFSLSIILRNAKDACVSASFSFFLSWLLIDGCSDICSDSDTMTSTPGWCQFHLLSVSTLKVTQRHHQMQNRLEPLSTGDEQNVNKSSFHLQQLRIKWTTWRQRQSFRLDKRGGHDETSPAITDRLELHAPGSHHVAKKKILHWSVTLRLQDQQHRAINKKSSVSPLWESSLVQIYLTGCSVQQMEDQSTDLALWREQKDPTPCDVVRKLPNEDYFWTSGNTAKRAIPQRDDSFVRSKSTKASKTGKKMLRVTVFFAFWGNQPCFAVHMNTCTIQIGSSTELSF